LQIKKNRINEFITSQTVRLVNHNGEMVGIVLLKEALEAAQNVGLDLVEVAPDSVPPVCKILDYSKQKYDAKKKASEARKKQKILTIKEVKVGPNISDHDYGTKLRQIRDFLASNHKVKVTMRFRGRELMHTEIGLEKLDKLMKDTEDVAKIELMPKREGNQFFLVLVSK
jgi:translation initiation factor IF-3